jgi:hypothetical protein
MSRDPSTVLLHAMPPPSPGGPAGSPLTMSRYLVSSGTADEADHLRVDLVKAPLRALTHRRGGSSLSQGSWALDRPGSRDAGDRGGRRARTPWAPDVPDVDGRPRVTTP